MNNNKKIILGVIGTLLLVFFIIVAIGLMVAFNHEQNIPNNTVEATANSTTALKNPEKVQAVFEVYDYDVDGELESTMESHDGRGVESELSDWVVTTGLSQTSSGIMVFSSDILVEFDSNHDQALNAFELDEFYSSDFYKNQY